MKKIAFVFSGQGSQYSGMGKDLYDNNAAVRNVFEEIDFFAKKNISELCFWGSEEELGKTVNTQPCVFAVDFATAEAIVDKGIFPQGVAGFSLGEYAALSFVGALSVSDATRLVEKRAEFMQEAARGIKSEMVAIIGLDSSIVENMCRNAERGFVSVSNYNSPQQTVIAGETSAVDEVIKSVEEAGGKTVRLSVSVPSHCELMREAGAALQSVLQETKIETPSIPIYFNFSGAQEHSPNKIKELMINQIQCPVRWTQTIEQMYNDGFNVFIECGPGKTLTGLVKKILKGRQFEAYHVEDTLTLDKIIDVVKL